MDGCSLCSPRVRPPAFPVPARRHEVPRPRPRPLSLGPRESSAPFPPWPAPSVLASAGPAWGNPDAVRWRDVSNPVAGPPRQASSSWRGRLRCESRLRGREEGRPSGAQRMSDVPGWAQGHKTRAVGGRGKERAPAGARRGGPASGKGGGEQARLEALGSRRGGDPGSAAHSVPSVGGLPSCSAPRPATASSTRRLSALDPAAPGGPSWRTRHLGGPSARARHSFV